MNISDLIQQRSAPQYPVQQSVPQQKETTPDGATFADTLESFVGDVNSMQKQSANLSERFIKGEAVDMHDVMIAAEKAKTGFQLLMELRNKGLDLYREAIKVQV
ncbi:MAG: flagellar hook-basal body complex protein FliE [Candidatus Kapabacteria bacterium]|nr:flagellar hook-basal body complex protein FliE [Candidatus Kapabacteria bacterium]